jgi:hypothetical protein
MASPAAGPGNVVDTLVIGAGQAGLATSYRLTRHGVEHQLLDQRPELGGAGQDRWDSFYLNTPNFAFLLPGHTYDGPEPDAFLPRDAVIKLYRNYAERIAAPVQLGTEVTRVARATGSSAPPAETAPAGGWQPAESGARLDLDAERITSVIWSTGYGLDFGFLDIPVLDQCNYPRHSRGVTEVPGLYTVGLPWLTRHASSTVAGVGADAEYVAAHIAGR